MAVAHEQHSQETEKDVKLMSCFKFLATETRDLYLSEEVPVIPTVPSALQFHRNWVCPNRPVIIKNAVDHWPALGKWSLDYLRDTLHGKEVSVALTPNGLADAVVDDHFVLPEEKTMRFQEFVDRLKEQGEDGGIYYIQKQNSNLTEEFPELLADVEPEIPWASEALDKKPDAVNLWIGSQESVTSMHKDHFENLYVVITGAKHFILHPPTDQPFIPYELFPAANYKDVASAKVTLEACKSPESVKWIPVDPVKPDFNRWPDYAKAQPIHCTVNPGEMLYLPSMWYHHVRQSEGTIAVNYWYDMEYDIKFNYFQFVEKLLSSAKDNT